MTTSNTVDKTHIMELSEQPTSGPSTEPQHHGVEPSSSRVLPHDRQGLHGSPLHQRHGERITAANAGDAVIDMTGLSVEDHMHPADQGAVLRHANQELAVAKQRAEHYDQGLLDEFMVARAEAMKSGDYTRARDLYFRLQGVDTPEKMQEWKDATEHGGKRYGRRGWPGLLINLVPPAAMPPAISSFSRTPVGAKLAAGNTGLTVAFGVAAAVAGYQTLLHTTPVQDSAFRGSPDIAPVMKKMNDDDVATLSAAGKKLDAIMEQDSKAKLNHIRGLFAHAAANPHQPELSQQAVSTFNRTLSELQQGLADYLMASLFLNVYQDGLKRQSLLQGLRMYINLIATWVAFKSGHPLGIAVIATTTLIQFFLQPHLAKKDKVDEQLNMIDLNIAAGTDAATLASGWRTAEQVRYRQLDALFKDDWGKIAKEASGLLKMPLGQWQTYKRLQMRDQAAGRWQALEVRYAEAIQGKPGVAKLKEQMTAARAAHDHQRERQLSDQLAGQIGMSPADCWEHHDLSQRESMRTPLNADDAQELATLRTRVTTSMPRDAKKADKYAQLDRDFEGATWDVLHMADFNLNALSSVKDHFGRAASYLDLEGSAEHGPLSLSAEYKIGFVQEGNRRGGAFDENGAGFVAAMMRGYQLLFANVNGPVLIGAAYSTITETLKARDPEFEETAAMRSASTGLIGLLIITNACASFASRHASAIPMNAMQKLQAALSSAGSIAETVYQISKLNVREELRRVESQKNGVQKLGLILQRTFEHLAVLIRSGFQDHRAGRIAKQAEKLVADLEKLREANPQVFERWWDEEGQPVLEEASNLIEDAPPGFTESSEQATSSQSQSQSQAQSKS